MANTVMERQLPARRDGGISDLPSAHPSQCYGEWKGRPIPVSIPVSESRVGSENKIFKESGTEAFFLRNPGLLPIINLPMAVPGASVFVKDVDSSHARANAGTLPTTGNPIGDIALATGFYDQSHFTR